ncbi:MAG: double-strand break repair helicase AddA [Alphaproteobacteria bacterium]|nr:double-strand break repair helicase AddA [Alphaproteobacteria bacterium]
MRSPVRTIDPRLDANQRQARASDPKVSAWVEANAGTGKTKVLTDRIVRLLLDGAAPQRILCLTFTKAAAAEMRNRLATLLGGWALAQDAALVDQLRGLTGRDPTPANMMTARRLFARVLDAPGGVSIQTIHSFCQSLLQRFPIEAGVSPNFAVLDESQSIELLQQAQDTQLALLASDHAPAYLAAALKDVAVRVSETEYVEIMSALLAERGRVTRLAGDPAALARYVARLRRQFGVEAAGSAADLLAAGCADAAIDRRALTQAARALAQGSKTDVERGATLSAWLAADPAARIERFGDYCSIFFTDKGEIRKTLATKAAVQTLPDVMEILTAEAVRAGQLADTTRSVRLIERTAALLQLGTDILVRYEHAKRARAALDYEDLVLRARDLLSRSGIAAWVLYKLDGGIDHVLIDEAQDTNPDQWDVVRHLTEEFFAGEGAVERERTVFAVGDAKQSIFGFQRADPARLAQMRQWFAERVQQTGRRFEHVELIDSYRSVSAVLDAVDQVFSAAPASEGVASEGHAIHHVAIRSDEPGIVEVWPVARPLANDADPTDGADRQDSLASPDERLALLIARHARDLIEGGERLANTGERIHAGHIMVLVRRRNAFVTALVRALKREGLPVAGVDRMTLVDELPVQDLMALGRFVLLPQDDLNLACLLKSPLVGVDEDGLFDLAWRRPGRLWAALRARAQAGDSRFVPVYEQLSAWLARADYTPPFEFYADILGAGRGRDKLLARLGREAADPIDEFLSAALHYQRGEVPSLQGFLRALEQGGSDIKRELDENRRREVRILTVHGAKGLQAPIVYLPDTSRVPSPQHRLLWSGDGRTVLWLPRSEDASDAARELLDGVKRREHEEQNRLLYVAMTRAADRLYVAGWAGSRNPDKGCWYELIAQAFVRDAGPSEVGGRARPAPRDFDFASMLGEREGWSGKGWRVASGDKPLPPDQPPLPLPDVSALPGWARRPPAPEPQPPVPLAPSRPFADEQPDAGQAPVFDPPPLGPFAPDRDTRFRRGNVIHHLLRVLPELPPSRRGAAGRRLLAAEAAAVDAGTRERWLAETLAVLDLPAASALFGRGSRAEVPVVGTVTLGSGPYSVSGQIDRLAVADHEVLIADFKTNRPPPRDAAGVPLVYRRQMSLYRSLLGQIYPDKTIRCFLLWTDGPRLMALPEAGLSAALP